MKRILFFIALLLTCHKIGAQDVDSLKVLLKKPMHDTARLEILSQLNRLSDDEWLHFAREQKKQALKSLKNTQKGTKLYRIYSGYLADAYYNEGIYYFEKSELITALDFQEKSLNIYTELGIENKKADPLSEMAKIYTLSSSYEKAVACFYATLRIYEKNHANSGIGDCYSGLGEIYTAQEQWDEAIRNHELAITYFLKSKEYDGACISLCNIADCLMAQEKYEEARHYLDQTDQYKSKINNFELAFIYLQRGVLADGLAKTDEAIHYYQLSKELSVLEEELGLICSTHFLIGKILFYQKKDAPQAIVYAKKALSLAKEIDFPAEIEKATRLLYEIYKSRGQFEEAFYYLEQYNSFLSQKNTSDIKNTLFQEQLKYDFEKKELLAKAAAERKINRLKIASERASFKKNVWLISIISLLLIGGISGYFLFKNNKQQKTIAEQKSNILKQKLLVTQMNPHFLFNSLNAIQNSIFKQDSLTAGTYLAQFADLMRMILDFSRKDTISLESEIKLLENYLQLQQFRFNNKFEYTLEIDPDLVPTRVQIPPMLAQPFIENAIEHGIFHLEGSGLIQIRILKKASNIRYEIQDNGVGLKKAAAFKTQPKTHHSLATIITQERINALFLNEKAGFQLEIIDLCEQENEQSGVLVIFEIPYQESKT